MWIPIEDLPENWHALRSSELPQLIQVWNEQADRLRNSGEFKTYMLRLRREIAIETGIIERLYTLDRGVTRLLIEQGFNEALIPHGATDQPPKKVIALIKDQERAVEGLFDFVAGQRDLSISYIRELHQVLTNNQESTEGLVYETGQIITIPLLRGDWKKFPNNPQRADGSIHEYCPPEQVASEMDKLINWHKFHLSKSVSPEVEAAWLHHRFTQIHPFQDGNGRVARCIASLVFIRDDWFPLALTRDDRSNYISALEKADDGDLSGLVNLFARCQKQAFLRSLGLSEQILSETRRAQVIISSVTEKLKQNQSDALKGKQEQAEKYATMLFEIAKQRLSDISKDIVLSVKNVMRDVKVFPVSADNKDEKAYYHRFQVVETAKQLDYFANLRDYHSWLQLVINVNSSTILLRIFSCHWTRTQRNTRMLCLRISS